jgi:Trypsin-co-occurring domain 2
MTDGGSVEGLGLAEAIEALRDDLLKARAAGAISEIQLPVESMTVELTVTATREINGKAGFKVPFVPVELGGREPGARHRADGDGGVRRPRGSRRQSGEGRPGEQPAQGVVRWRRWRWRPGWSR